MFEEDSDDDGDEQEIDNDAHGESQRAAPKGREAEFRRRVDALFAKKKEEQDFVLAERRKRERQRTIRLNRERMRREREREKQRKAEERKRKAAEIRAKLEQSKAETTSASPHRDADRACGDADGSPTTATEGNVLKIGDQPVNTREAVRKPAANTSNITDEELQQLVAEISVSTPNPPPPPPPPPPSPPPYTPTTHRPNSRRLNLFASWLVLHRIHSAC